MNDWRDDAKCRDMDPSVFFADHPLDIAFAKNICRRCPVKPVCDQYAQTHHIPYGVWGGKDRTRRVAS